MTSNYVCAGLIPRILRVGCFWIQVCLIFDYLLGLLSLRAHQLISYLLGSRRNYSQGAGMAALLAALVRILHYVQVVPSSYS